MAIHPTEVSLQALKQAQVPYVVAPYEADAQMAYMARSGIVDLVITEDSDLLAYGCPEVVFKLQRGGDCDHIRIADLPMNRCLSFSGLDHDNFIEVRPR
jgi:exonuclease 1